MPENEATCRSSRKIGCLESLLRAIRSAKYPLKHVHVCCIGAGWQAVVSSPDLDSPISAALDAHCIDIRHEIEMDRPCSLIRIHLIIHTYQKQFQGRCIYEIVLPNRIFVNTFCQIANDHFILPWSEVDGHRPLDLCPILVDDH